jgi:hypothetical protein
MTAEDAISRVALCDEVMAVEKCTKTPNILGRVENY